MMDQTQTKSKSSTAAAAPPAKLHAGKWTPEEEAYVEGLMEEFRAGTLDLQEGTTLRSFLAKKLNCKPKRISKKYEGKNYDGKQLYWNAEDPVPPMERRARMAKLAMLEQKFKDCLKTIEMVKASKTGATLPSVVQDEPLAAAKTSASPSMQLQQQQRTTSPLSPDLSTPASSSALFGLADLYRADPASAYLQLARQRQQQEAALASGANGRGSPLLSGLQHHRVSLGSNSGTSNSGHGTSARNNMNMNAFLSSAPGTYAAARQEALLGLSGLRSTSPSSALAAAAGFSGYPRAPSPSSLGPSRFDLEQAAVLELEQARIAAGLGGGTGAYSSSSFRPSFNTMLNSRRFHSGNQLAAAGAPSDLDLLRLQRQQQQQQPMRDLGGADLQAWRRQLQAAGQQQQQQAGATQERKRLIEDELLLQQQRQESASKRQRLL